MGGNQLLDAVEFIELNVSGADFGADYIPHIPLLADIDLP